jgi:hypothetical protein
MSAAKILRGGDHGGMLILPDCQAAISIYGLSCRSRSFMLIPTAVESINLWFSR